MTDRRASTSIGAVSRVGGRLRGPERNLDDLALLGLVDRHKEADHDTAAWRFDLTQQARDEWPRASPEVFKV